MDNGLESERHHTFVSESDSQKLKTGGRPTKPQWKKKKRKNVKKKDKPTAIPETNDETCANDNINDNDSVKVYSEVQQVSPRIDFEPPMTTVILQSPNIELSPTGPMSPRKQTIMRYKKSDSKMNDDFIHEARDNLRSSVILTTESPSEKKTHVDEKAELFKHKSSKILVFDELAAKKDDEPTSSGRLLAHGDFEVFQLHNGDVTYLSCGPSFIYPLLPKLKVLRVEFNQFVLPLVNPERYWKIFINSDDPKVIENLEITLDKVVQYRNLAIGAKPPVNKTKENFNIKDEVPEIDELIIMKFNMESISSQIPDSPPSPPVSPHKDSTMWASLQLGSPLKPPNMNTELRRMANIPRENSSNSITSGLACFDVSGFNHQYNEMMHVHNPRAQSSSTLKKPADTKSESSMDSLLDEFEESISVSKSFTYSKSRPMSRSSSFVQAPMTFNQVYQSPLMANTFKEADVYSDYDEFPNTSLSEYNRTHNLRSRRSSKSELYTSESNWMEPSRPKVESSSKLPLSRSTYSVSSGHENYADLNNTYRQIYKSLTQRNLAQIVNDRDDRSSKASPRLPTIPQARTLKTSNLRDPRKPIPNNTTKLNSENVYKLISDQASIEEPKKGFASRLFGW